MTREEAIEVLDKMKYPQKVNKNGFVISNVNIENEALNMAISALEQVECFTNGRGEVIVCDEFKGMSCEDAISREAVQDLMATWLNLYLTDETREALEIIDSKIGDMPSVTQKSETVTEFADRCRECGARYGKYRKEAKRWKNKWLKSQKSGKWDRLYNWLNDMRLGIAPDETVTDIDEQHCRESQTDILDEIMEWMIKAESEEQTE